MTIECKTEEAIRSSAFLSPYFDFDISRYMCNFPKIVVTETKEDPHFNFNDNTILLREGDGEITIAHEVGHWIDSSINSEMWRAKTLAPEDPNGFIRAMRRYNLRECIAGYSELIYYCKEDPLENSQFPLHKLARVKLTEIWDTPLPKEFHYFRNKILAKRKELGLLDLN